MESSSCAMSEPAANKAVLPPLCPRILAQASESLWTGNDNVRVHSPYGVLDGSKVAAIAANFVRQDRMKVWSGTCLPYCFPLFVRSLLLGDYRRPAATRSSASAVPPSGLRLPSKSYSASTPKRFVRTSRPRSQGFAQCDPNETGKFRRTETLSCTRTK
jgi:hypothetical protein